MQTFLRATFATFVFILISSRVLTFTPEWTDIPDVLICDDMCGSGIDGLFVFTNAFNFFDYVYDSDTTTTSLRIVYAETAHTYERELCAGGVQDVDQLVSVNGKTEVTLAGLSLSDFLDSAKEVTNSGTVSEATISATAAGDDRDVVLIVTDFTTTPQASNCFRVRAIDDDDCCWPPEPSQCLGVKTWDTNFNSADWAFVNFTLGGTGSLTSSMTANAMSIVDGPTGSSANFWYGYFETSSSSDIAYVANTLYRARFTISTNQANPVLVPAIRLVLTSATTQSEGSYLIVNPRAGAAPTATAKPFDLYIEPLVAEPLRVSSQIIDGSTVDYGTITFESILIDTCAISYCLSNWYVIDQGGNSDFSRWTSFTLGAPAITLTQTSSQMSFNVPPSASPSSFIQTDVAEMNGPILIAGDFYRVQFTVSSTTPQITQPTFRMRVLDSQQGWGVIKVLNSRGTAAHMPASGGTTYNLYFYSDMSWMPGKVMKAGFDILHFDPDDYGNEVLTRVEFTGLYSCF